MVGSPPALENIATLIDPPASVLSEPEWIAAIIEGCKSAVLLDQVRRAREALATGRARRETKQRSLRELTAI